MNSMLRPIFARRSVRKYTDQAVSEEHVRDLLEAAMAAPSAVACDPWHFVVIRHPATLKTLADALPDGRHLAHANVGILVCGETERAHDSQLSYVLQDCAAATENILLAASMLGLGACWCGVHPRKERMDLARKLADLPAGMVPVCVVAVGWPAQRPDARTRYRAGSIHQEHW